MRDLSVKLLEDLVALSQSHSLLQAAQARHVTHPAFGRRIRQLEAWAGVPLVERAGRAGALTPAGRQMLAAAREVLDVLARTHATLKQSAGTHQTRLSMAAGRTLSHVVLPGLLDSLYRRVPEVQWRIVTTSLRFGLEMLLAGEVDFLACHAQDDVDVDAQIRDLAYRRVGDDALVAVSAPLVPGYPRYAVPRSDGDAAVPFLAYADSMSLGRILRGRLPALCDPARLAVIYESDLADAIHAMVRQGSGLAWLPHSLVKDDLARGVLVRADGAGRDIPVEVRLYVRPGAGKPAVGAVWEALGELLPDH